MPALGFDCTTMNPLEWKREHQIALLIAIGLGCVAGLLLGILEIDTYTRFRWGALWCDNRGHSCIHLLNGYWVRVVLCAILGGLMGAALVYVRQLLRADAEPKHSGPHAHTGASAVVKSEKGQLRSRLKVRTALKEFLAAADKALCKTDGEVRKTIHSDNGYRMIGGRIWGYSVDLVEAQRSLIRECLSALSASVTSERDLESALWDAAVATGSEEAREDIFFKEIESARTVQKTFIGPNRLIRLSSSVSALAIGRVKIISTSNVKSKIEGDHIEIRLGDREGLQTDGKRAFIEFPPFAWEVALLSSREYAREEAQWNINIAISLVRLGLINRGGKLKSLFPYPGDVEAHPLVTKGTHHNVGIISSQGTESFGGSTMLHWYEIDSDDVKHFDAIKLSRIADVVFDPPGRSVGERLNNGLGWMTLARQTLPRAERFIHFFTALEALLTHSDPTAPITQTIARYLSCIVTSKNEDRVTVADTIRKLYAKRSVLIH